MLLLIRYLILTLHTTQIIQWKGEKMMPLSLAEPEKELTIKKLGGSPEIRQHLENLGFTVGGTVTLINILGESVIVRVKESRVAIGADLARRIMV